MNKRLASPLSGRALVASFFESRAEKGLRSAPRSESEWEEVIRAASAEFLLPAFHRRLKELEMEIPYEVGYFLMMVEEMNRERNERILDEARAIASVLNGIGIEPVLLKGAAYLVEGVYPDAGCRYLCDLDLLIPASRLEAAVEALGQEGYLPDTSDAMADFRHHHPQLQRPRTADGSGSAPVELHHSLGHGISRRLLSGEEMYGASRLLEWRGVRVRVPPPEHLVTHLILHSQIHHTYSERIWPPARAIYDLAMLNRFYGNRLDWEAVRKRFQKHGEESTLLLHLLQVNQTLGMPMPARGRCIDPETVGQVCNLRPICNPPGLKWTGGQRDCKSRAGYNPAPQFSGSGGNDAAAGRDESPLSAVLQKPGWTLRVRWTRRQALNRWPALRFIDPAYLCLSTVSRRIRFLKSVLSVPGGRKHATRMLLQRGFYRRLLAEISLR